MFLIPFIDMLNHKSPIETKWNYDSEKQGFIVKSLVDVPRGSIVNGSYGDKLNNYKTYQWYGFIDDKNPHNSFRFDLKISENTTDWETKLEHLSHPRYHQQTFDLSFDFEPQFLNMLSFARYIVFNEGKQNIYLAKN